MRCNSGVIFDDVNYSEEKYRQLFADLCFTRLSVLFGSWSRQSAMLPMIRQRLALQKGYCIETSTCCWRCLRNPWTANRYSPY